MKVPVLPTTVPVGLSDPDTAQYPPRRGGSLRVPTAVGVAMAMATPTIRVFMLTVLPPARTFELPKTIARRDVLIASAPALFASSSRAVAAPAAPLDFDLLPEPGRPYIHYLDNADKLAGDLLRFVDSGSMSTAAELEAEIVQFAATYSPRPGASNVGPGYASLKASYDALTFHFARYRGRDATEPLPATLASTVRSNAEVARKRLRKVKASQERAKGAWPTCQGVPLGSRATQCSTGYD